MHIWSILLTKSDLKWCIQLSRSFTIWKLLSNYKKYYFQWQFFVVWQDYNIFNCFIIFGNIHVPIFGHVRNINIFPFIVRNLETFPFLKSERRFNLIVSMLVVMKLFNLVCVLWSLNGIWYVSSLWQYHFQWCHTSTSKFDLLTIRGKQRHNSITFQSMIRISVLLFQICNIWSSKRMDKFIRWYF